MFICCTLHAFTTTRQCSMETDGVPTSPPPWVEVTWLRSSTSTTSRQEPGSLIHLMETVLNRTKIKRFFWKKVFYEYSMPFIFIQRNAILNFIIEHDLDTILF